MQFKVPQFIDIEDKILGPLTWRQFAYCLGAAGITYISLRFIPGGRIVGLLVASPFAGLFLALAFIKINNRPFIETLEHGFNYITGSNIYTWQKQENTTETKQIIPNQINKETLLPNYERKSLKDLATNLDTRQGSQN